MKNFQSAYEFMVILLVAALLMAGCAGDLINIDRLKETNQDIYGCMQLDIAARGGRVNLLLVPIGKPLPPDVKIPTC